MNSGTANTISGAEFSLNRNSRYILWILAIGAAITFFMNILVDNSVVFHDEYVYKASADHRLSTVELHAKGASEYIPNRLFASVYRIASFAEQNFYVAAQFFNVLFWITGIGAVCRLAQGLGLTGKRLFIFAALCITLPFSAYTKYFMPEAMFFCFFAICVLSVFNGIAERSNPLMFLAGIAAGLAYYVKPHAIIFFGITLLFLLLTLRTVDQRWRRIGWYVLGFVAVLVIGTMLIEKPKTVARLGVYDQMVKGMMATTSTMLKDPGANIAAVGKVGLGHAILLLSVWTISVMTSIAACVSLWRDRLTDQAVDAGKLFVAWIFFIVIALVTMVIAFTVLVAEVGRIHSRYYCFIYPFLLLAMFVYDSSKHGPTTKVVMTVFAVVFSLALLALPSYSGILGISLVSDSPEIGFAFLSARLTIVAVLLLGASQVYAIWHSPRPLWLVLAVLFLGSQYYVREAQGHMFRGPYTDGRDATTVEQILGPEKLRSSLVVGESRDAVSKFLFNLSVVPSVIQRPLDQLDSLAVDYPSFDSYLVLSDKVDGIPNMTCQRLGARVFKCDRS